MTLEELDEWHKRFPCIGQKTIDWLKTLEEPVRMSTAAPIINRLLDEESLAIMRSQQVKSK